MADALGATGGRYVRNGHHHQDAPIDHSNPYFRFDPAKCQTVQQLLEEADAELYSSKRRRSTAELS